MTKTSSERAGTYLSDDEIRCLESANSTFGHRTFDDYPIFKKLERDDLVYETVRAFYTTEAGRAALAAKDGR